MQNLTTDHTIPASVTLSNTEPRVLLLNLEAVDDVVERLGDSFTEQEIPGGLVIVAGTITGDGNSTRVVLAVEPVNAVGVVVQWDSGYTQRPEPADDDLDMYGWALGDAEADPAAYSIPPLGERLSIPPSALARLFYIEQTDSVRAVRSNPVWVHVCEQFGPGGVYRGVTTEQSNAGPKGTEIYFEPEHVVEIKREKGRRGCSPSRRTTTPPVSPSPALPPSTCDDDL